MDFRFVAYNPQTGQRLYQLPRANSVQIGDTFGTRGTLKLKYSAKAINAIDLPTFLEVQAEVTFDDGHTWAEVGPSLLRLSGEHEDTDASGMRTLRFVGREWVLDKARVGAGNGELVDGKRAFYQATPGQIIRTLILEAQDRGAAHGIDLGGFTEAKDAAGNTWSKSATIYYSPGLPIGSVLENLVEQGLCDYRLDGRTLNLYEPETAMGRDLTDRDNPVRVHGAVTEAPVKYSLEDLASAALLIGDEGFELEVENPSAPDDYGRLEVTIEQGGVSDAGTARLMVDEALQRGSREIREITRSQSAAGASFLPYRDYRVGDYVQVLEDGQWQKYRVRELQLARDGQEWTIHTVINDRLQELLLKLAKRTSGIVNGSKGSGGDGTRPTPPENPGIEPAAPEGLVIDQQVYLDRQGIARGQITAGWGAVTESTKGQAVEIGGYELWTRRNETHASWVRVASTDGDLTATHSPVVLSDADGNALEYQWRVRAIAQASNRPGPWSDTVTLTMTQDTEPPNVPSLPTVATDLRIVTVDWDGLDESAEAMPVDFNHLRIYFAAAEDMAGAERVGSLSQSGVWNSGTMAADVPVWVAVSAVDHVGNESAMTPAQSATPKKLVDDDSIRDAVEGIDDKINNAVDDLNEAIDNIVVDSEGTKNFYRGTKPTDEESSEGDLWFDSSDENKPYIYQDGEWVTVRDSFVKPPTSLNVTDWGMLQPNMKAIQGQWSSSGYRVEVEDLEALNNSPLAVVNIPDADTGGGYITLPFQGVLDGSDKPDYSDNLFVNEGRPISIDLQLLYNGPFQPAAGQRTLTAHYFADGELVDSSNIEYATLSKEAFPAAADFSNPVAYYANFLGYQFGMRITGTVSPTRVASVDEIALTVAIPLPAGSGAEKKLAVWSIDSRVQVPSTGLADGAVTETKVSDDSISTPKLQSKVITTDKIATGAITAESGIIADLSAGVIKSGTLDAARIAAGSLSADTVLVPGSAGSTVIADGAITTDKILANAITAGKIAAGAIEADHISANAITADKIKAGAIDGKLITGARIRTAASGRRTELDVEGLKSYDSSGNTVLTTQTSDGSIEMKGILRQTARGQTIVVGGEYQSSGPGIQWEDSNIWNYPPGVAYGTSPDDANSKRTLVQGPGVSEGNSFLTLYEKGNQFDLRTWKGTGSSRNDWAVEARLDDNLMRIGSPTNDAPSVYMKRSSSGGYVRLRSGDDAHVTATENQVFVQANSSGGGGVYMRRGPGGGSGDDGYMSVTSDGIFLNPQGSRKIDLISDTIRINGDLPVAGSWANLVRSDGNLAYVPSSRRYKMLEEPIEDTVDSFEDKILSVQAKTWYYRQPAERYAEYLSSVANGDEPERDLEALSSVVRTPGLIAEDMHDAGLGIFVTYDEEGRPDSVMHEGIAPALISIIRRLRDRVDVLEQQLGATA